MFKRNITLEKAYKLSNRKPISKETLSSLMNVAIAEIGKAINENPDVSIEIAGMKFHRN